MFPLAFVCRWLSILLLIVFHLVQNGGNHRGVFDAIELPLTVLQLTTILEVCCLSCWALIVDILVHFSYDVNFGIDLVWGQPFSAPFLFDAHAQGAWNYVYRANTPLSPSLKHCLEVVQRRMGICSEFLVYVKIY